MQNYELKNKKIKEEFLRLKKEQPERFKKRLNLSWSNWGFGIEPFEMSVKRLAGAGIEFIELHGNHYGNDLGYKPRDTKNILDFYGVKTGGICGMFGKENDLSSNSHAARQNAVDYIKRELRFASEVGAEYMLVVPGAVGRPLAYDSTEFERSVETLLTVADLFVSHSVKAAIEPIRSAEVSFIHTVEDAKRYISAVNHNGVRHINGDVYHMQSEETHIGETLLDAGDMLVNLHAADSNRRALGTGSLDLDTIIMSLYLIGHNAGGRYFTPEPLGPGGDPYPAMNAVTAPEILDRLVNGTAKYFKDREEFLLNL